MSLLLTALVALLCAVALAKPFDLHFAPTSTGTTCNITVATSQNVTVRSDCQIVWKGLTPIIVLQTELNIIKTIIAARINDTSYNGTNSDPNNKYAIRYSVYNLLLSAVYPLLIEAFNAGVYVQVLIESSQVDPCRFYNTALGALKAGGLRVPCFAFDTSVPICGNASSCFYNSSSCTIEPGCVPAPGAQGYGYIPSQLDVADPTAWNLLPIVSVNSFAYKSNNTNTSFDGWVGQGLMHTKMRLLRWFDATTSENRSVVVSGSLNPDSSAPFNDETLFISEEQALVDQYHKVFQAVLTLGRLDEQTFVNPPYNASAEYNLFFSKGGIKGGPQLSQTLLQVLGNETELIIITVYTLRDFGGLTAVLQKAAKAGAFIMVLTDLDEVVGEPGFAAPDYKCTTQCFSSIPLHPKFGKNKFVPVYGCKNANGIIEILWTLTLPVKAFSAFHHKNMVVGVSNMRVLTDTTNWSGSGAGINYGLPAPNCCASGQKPHESQDYMQYQSATTVPPATGTPSPTYPPPRFNAQSTVANCETALWVNEGNNFTVALQFVETFFYLIEKYYTYTLANIGTITAPGGYVLFPNATFINNTATVYTGYDTSPTQDVFPNIMTPKEIAGIMLKMPSLAKNPLLQQLIKKYA